MRRTDTGWPTLRAARGERTGLRGALLVLGLCLITAAVAADEPLGDIVVDHVAALKGRTAIPAGYASVALAWVAQLPIPALRTEADIAALAEASTTPSP